MHTSTSFLSSAIVGPSVHEGCALTHTTPEQNIQPWSDVWKLPREYWSGSDCPDLKEDPRVWKTPQPAANWLQAGTQPCFPGLSIGRGHSWLTWHVSSCPPHWIMNTGGLEVYAPLNRNISLPWGPCSSPVGPTSKLKNPNFWRCFQWAQALKKTQFPKRLQGWLGEIYPLPCDTQGKQKCPFND